jgi:autotransporter-associated beta strand protein
LLRVGIGETNKSTTLGTGPVTNYGTLEFNLVGTNVFTNNLSGNGTLNLANTNLTLRLFGNNSAFTGNILVNLGSLWITNASALGTGPKNVTVTGGGNSLFTQLHLDGSLANITLPADISLTLSYLNGVLLNDGGTNTVLGNIIMPFGGGNAYVKVNSGFLTVAGNVMSDGIAGGRVFQLGGAGNGLFSGSAGDMGSNGTPQLLSGITKTDAGTWTVSGANTTVGALNANAGTLILSGSWSNGPAVVASGGTLMGTGISSNLTVNSGGKFVPGAYGSIGTFTVSNLFTLSGAMYVSLNKSLAQSNSFVNIQAVGATNNVANTGSSLVVSNLGPALVAGDKFYLFNQAVTNGNLVTLTVPTLSGGLGFTNMLNVDGSIEVVQAVNPNPGTIQFSLSGNALTLSWPTNLGWTLQAQTNTLSVGLRTNWFDVTGSTTVTQSVITINPANPTVFYRLRL